MTRIIPSPTDRADELYDVVAKVFSGGGYFDFLRFCREAYFAGSSYDWAVSRVIETDGRIVSHVGVWPYRMRVGRARLLTGGIGAVMTHADYRRRGYASRVMFEVIKAMRGAGYHLSVLFGRPDFYHRFGYAQAWPVTRHVADVNRLGDESLRLTLRKVRLTEALCRPGAVMRIYNRENATRTGTAERPIYARSGGEWLNADCRTLSDRSGRVRGYLITRKCGDDLEVREAGGLRPPCGVGQLLAAIRHLARHARCKRVRTDGLAYSHPLCAALRLGDCRVEMQHYLSGGPMAAMISLPGCLEAMADELADRLRASTLSGFKGVLGIEAMRQKAALRLSAGRVRLVPPAGRTPHRIAAGRQIVRLLIGSEPPSVLADQPGLRFAGAAAELAEVLFPHQWPMLNAVDHF